MKIDGYGCTAEFDGETLTLTATNAMSRAALLGSKSLGKVADKAAVHAENVAAGKGQDLALPRLSVEGDSVAIPRQSIVSVDMKNASALTNGKLTVATTDGKSFQAHFRKKQSEGFGQLAAQLA